MKYLFLITFILICFSSCGQSTRNSLTVCNGLLINETVKYKWLDVVEEYLTDSSTFRFFVGKYDNAHEVISIICHNDTLNIYNMKMNNQGHFKDKSIRMYLLTELKKKNYTPFCDSIINIVN